MCGIFFKFMIFFISNIEKYDTHMKFALIITFKFIIFQLQSLFGFNILIKFNQLIKNIYMKLDKKGYVYTYNGRYTTNKENK